MDAGLIIAIVSLAISMASLIFTYSQVRVAVKTAKSEIAITLIDQLYSNETIQNILQMVYDKKLALRSREGGFIDIVATGNGAPAVVTPDVDLVLNRFQIIGHLLTIGVLELRDLQGIRYEIIRLGRDSAVRGYLAFLSSEYQQLSGVQHDHFGFFRQMYNAFEEAGVTGKRDAVWAREVRPAARSEVGEFAAVVSTSSPNPEHRADG